MNSIVGLKEWLLRLAGLSFSLTLITLPLRYRFVLLERSSPPIYRDYTDFLVFASDIFLIATLAFWLSSLALAPRRIQFKPYFLTLPVLGLSVVGLISVFASLDAWLSLYHAVRLVLLDAFYIYILNEITSLRKLVLPISIQVLGQAVIGIFQVLKQQDAGLQALGEYRLNPAWSGVSIIGVAGTRLLRAYGLSDHPNILGGCLAFALILIAIYYATSNSVWRAPTMGVFSLGLVALFLTFSRSAWLAFALAGVAIAFLAIRVGHKQVLIHLLVLIGCSLIVAMPFLWNYANYIGVRLTLHASLAQSPQELQSVGTRQLLNTAANQLFSAHALIGTGLGTFPLALRQLYPQFPTDYQPVHFTLLEAAAETGIFGAMLYAIAITSPWVALWLNRRRMTISLALIGFTGLILAITIVGFFDYYTWLLAPGRLWQWLAWGLWGRAYCQSISE